jgi:hypothetical protein
MTDRLHTDNVAPADYAAAFLHTLDNPHQLWDTAFRTHIRPMCRHLLLTLFFCSEYGAGIDDLKTAFDALHPVMCKIYNISHEAKDFEEALKILEGGFIAISGGRISFINPSLRDYLTDYLNDASLKFYHCMGGIHQASDDGIIKEQRRAKKPSVGQRTQFSRTGRRTCGGKAMPRPPKAESPWR